MRVRIREGDEKRLKPPRNPEGGWLPPNLKELSKFWSEIQDEAIRRFGVDEDGDACVLVSLTDNSREESMNFQAIPRDIEESPYHPYGNKKWKSNKRDPKTNKFAKPHTPEQEETRRKAILENKFWIQRMINLNWTLAHERMERLVRESEYELRKEIERPEKERAARIKTLQHRKEWWADPIKSLRDSGYVVDEEHGEYWYGKNDGLDGKTRVKKIPTRPAEFEAEMEELERLLAYKPAREIAF